MLSSLDPKSNDTWHSNRDCSANSGSTETKTIICDCADARNKIESL